MFFVLWHKTTSALIFICGQTLWHGIFIYKGIFYWLKIIYNMKKSRFLRSKDTDYFDNKNIIFVIRYYIKYLFLSQMFFKRFF